MDFSITFSITFLSFFLSFFHLLQKRARDYELSALETQRKPNQEILDHERKRKVELQCLELQVELEDKG